jgi:hypothetical protein
MQTSVGEIGVHSLADASIGTVVQFSEEKALGTAGRLHSASQRMARVSTPRALSCCRGIKQKALHTKMKGSRGGGWFFLFRIVWE